METKTLSCWLFIISLSFTVCEMEVEINGPCKLRQFDGTCVLITSCKIALEIIKLRNSTFIKEMNCGYEKLIPKVCCPNDILISNEVLTTTLQPSTSTITLEKANQNDNEEANLPTLSPFDVLPGRDVCGPVHEESRIYGGTIAAIDEFPWLARLKFYDPIQEVEVYGCSGSLISDRFVLTASHCVGIYKVLSVRFGEWDSETTRDCQEGVCNEDLPVDVKIDEIYKYSGPDYIVTSSGIVIGDIALLRLKHPVNFTDFVRPVCLPTTPYIAKQDYIDSTYITAGWGVTEFGEQSVIKRKVAIDAVSYHTCRATLAGLPDTHPPTVICAGGRKGQDSCTGDSGGPLVRTVAEDYKENWYLYGITSSGVKECGAAGKPGIYTRVTSYMDWILKTMASN